MSSLFVTGTGTGIGKTVLSCALARAARREDLGLAALKPIETGCDPHPADALALAEACGRAELALAEGFYRVRPALCPHAATLSGAPPLDYAAVLDATRRELRAGDAIVEGAGGLLVPLDAQRTMRDFAVDLALPLVLVARDGLGVLSHVLTAMECAQGLEVRAVVLSRFGPPEASQEHNRAILEERLRVPVRCFEDRPDAADRLLALLQLNR